MTSIVDKRDGEADIVVDSVAAIGMEFKGKQVCVLPVMSPKRCRDACTVPCCAEFSTIIVGAGWDDARARGRLAFPVMREILSIHGYCSIFTEAICTVDEQVDWLDIESLVPEASKRLRIGLPKGLDPTNK